MTKRNSDLHNWGDANWAAAMLRQKYNVTRRGEKICNCTARQEHALITCGRRKSKKIKTSTWTPSRGKYQGTRGAKLVLSRNFSTFNFPFLGSRLRRTCLLVLFTLKGSICLLEHENTTTEKQRANWRPSTLRHSSGWFDESNEAGVLWRKVWWLC